MCLQLKMDLVAFLGKDIDSWKQVNALINKGEWGKIALLKNKDSEAFPKKENTEIINIDCSRNLIDLKEDIQNKLSKVIGKEFEIALSIASGNGKEHMALISALLSIPVGVRLVAFTKDGVKFIN